MAKARRFSGRNRKTLEIGERTKLACPLLSEGHERGAEPAATRKDRKMDSDTSNLFARRDTFFGICEAVGQDFGFNPLWLRLAFVAPLFFFPVQTFMGYFGLGVVVLASRLIFPRKTAAAQPTPTAIAPATSHPSDATPELALAA